MEEQNGYTHVYWGKNKEHEMCPCKRKCPGTQSCLCMDAENCVDFRRWHFKEMGLIKDNFYKNTGRRM